MTLLGSLEAYHKIILLAYTLYVIAAAVLVSRHDAEIRTGDTIRRLPASFLLISLIAFLLMRLPTIFVDAPWNPDEAQYLAAAIKFRSNMNSWASADINSSGPLNGFAMMWPFLFGRETGFAVAHMTAVAVLALTWLFLLSALRSTPRDVRIFLGGATILLLGAFFHDDYQEFASELVPCCLLMFSTAVAMAATEERARLPGILAAGFCLGAVAFAKLQAIPAALTIGLILLGLTLAKRPKPWRSALLLAASACLPAALILTPLAMAKGFHDFWMSYIYSGMIYAQSGWKKVEPTKFMPAQIVALAGMLMNRLTKVYLLGLGVVSVAAFASIVVEADWRKDAHSWRKTLSSPDSLRFLISALILASGVFAAASPSRPFPHYSYFIIWPAALFAGLAWSLARSIGKTSPLAGARLSGALGAFLVGVIGVVAALENRSGLREMEVLNNPAGAFRPLELLPIGHEGRGRAFVWGWMAELYVWSGWTPATRDQISYFQIWPSSIRDAYRDRAMADLIGNPPDYVIDAVGKGSFDYLDPRVDGIASFPALAQYVSDNDTLVSRSVFGSGCPRIYASRDAAAELKKAYLPPAGVSASAGSQTTEAARVGAGYVTCVDSVWFPSESTGRIVLDLGGAKDIADVEILNIPMPFADANRQGVGKLHAVVRAFDGETVTLEQDLVVPAYPQWTIVKGNGPVVADKIVVEAERFPHELTLIRVRRRLDA